jgi:putrescine transport system substrate-binding protein
LVFFIWPYAAFAQGKAVPDKTLQEKTVNLYAWADYFDPTVLDDFTKETGIKIAYDTYDTNDALDARLALGKSGYDVVVLSGPLLQKEIAAGILQKLEKAKLPAAKTLWLEIMARLSIYDPGNQYALNYMWFTMGLTFNAKTIEDRSAANVLASWDVVFRPDLLQKFADCGVEVQDSPNELFAVALRYMGLDPRSKSLVDLKRAGDLLYGLRRNVKKFRATDDLSGLVGGDVCLGLGWSSDAAQARKQAGEANSGVTIGYAIPKSGTLVLLDNLAIPKDAPNADAAYALINYLMRPDIAARDTKATHFANGVLASKAFLPQEILADPSIYPDEAAMKSFFVMGSYGPTEQAFIAKEWLRVKNGDIKPTISKNEKSKTGKNDKTAGKKDEKSPVKKTEKVQSHADRDRR